MSPLRIIFDLKTSNDILVPLRYEGKKREVILFFSFFSFFFFLEQYDTGEMNLRRNERSKASTGAFSVLNEGNPDTRVCWGSTERSGRVTSFLTCR